MRRLPRPRPSLPGRLRGLMSGPRRTPPRSLEMALQEAVSANLALISTPGDYAAAEAMKALRLGLNVMLFSDNVSLDDEIALKRYARSHELLVMGPDCGTAIIGGVPLGFANVVRRGAIGAIAASGTGLQQVTCLIDRWGEGISQAIGTGGHDLRAEVGGITMLQGLEALAADPATRVIVLISKPPHPDGRGAGPGRRGASRQADRGELSRRGSGYGAARERASGAHAGGRRPARRGPCRRRRCRSWRGTDRGHDRGGARAGSDNTSAGSTAAAPSATRRCCC